MAEHDDSNLIRRTLEGETDAFGYMVRRYQDRLFNGMAHMLRCEVEAEDVVQEAFILAMTRLTSFRGDSSFFTWLYRIAFNVAVSRRRKKRPTVSMERDQVNQTWAEENESSSPSHRMEQQERISLVHQALGQLSEEHRAILVLREMDGQCYETISEILDMPIGTVRSRLHRARMQLKQQIENLEKRDDPNEKTEPANTPSKPK